MQEKKQVQLEEKKKHAINQQKKLNKSITDDTHARSSAISWVGNHDETIAKSRKELDRLEAKLVDEEKEFESIRDGLKGQPVFLVLNPSSKLTFALLPFLRPSDKTAEFSDQIEIKQQELEPWTAKISEKQAGVDVATSERDLLVEKASGMKDGIVEAEAALEKLREGGEGKVNRSRQSQFHPRDAHFAFPSLSRSRRWTCSSRRRQSLRSSSPRPRRRSL